MKSRPIIFSAPMIRALLDGRKTQTRRVVKPQPSDDLDNLGDGITFRDMRSGRDYRCPHGEVGDLLWVRETWAQVGTLDPGYLVYRATYPDCLPANVKEIPRDIREAGYRWRPSIHMPRWSSRLTLRITDVRVQRVQEISDEDALAEGIWCDNVIIGAHCAGGVHQEICEDQYFTPLTPDDTEGHKDIDGAMCALWNSINAKRGYPWESNPWVWAITFEVIQKNVDEVLREAA